MVHRLSDGAVLDSSRVLRLQEAQFRTLFENADLGIVMFDAAGDISRLNSAVAQMLGPDEHAVLSAQHETVLRFRSAPSEPVTRDASRGALSSADLCARIGEDAFAMIVRGTLAPAVLEEIAARIGSRSPPASVSQFARAARFRRTNGKTETESSTDSDALSHDLSW